MAVPNLLQVTVHWQGYGEEGTLSWHLAPVAGSHDEEALSGYLDNLVSTLSTEDTPSAKSNFLALLTTGQHVDKFAVYQRAVDNEPVTSQAIKEVTGWTGTSSGFGSPLQCCLVASLRTAGAGPSRRGRQYIPAHTIGVQNTTALVSASACDQVGGVAGQWGATVRDRARAELSDDSIRWVVYSRTLRSAAEITTLRVDSRMDTQRRREASLAPDHTSVFSVGV